MAIEQTQGFKGNIGDLNIDQGINLPQRNSLPSVIAEFDELTQHPPRKDPYMRSCYEAASLLAQSESPFNTLLTDVLEQRKMPAKHFANLFFRAIQFIELHEFQNKEYPFAYTETQKWEKELETITTHKGSLLKELLLTKDTTSTIYQRYAGARAIMSSLYSPDYPLKVADFGCGGNYGLPGISLNEQFNPIVDNTNGKVVEALLQRPFSLSRGVGIDRQDVKNPDVKKWSLTCSFYPQELTQLQDVLAFESRLAEVPNVTFLQQDLLALPIGYGENEVYPNCDVVIISTLCYQLSKEQQDVILRNARGILNPEGAIIVQDFAKKDPNDPQRLNFEGSWFAKPFAYRNFLTSAATNWEFKELLQWSDGRCKEVKPGEDFPKEQSFSSQTAA